jgi:hypothetical protein
MTPRQDLANVYYQALLNARYELGRKVAIAAAKSDVTSRELSAEHRALQEQYDAVVTELEEAMEECKQADAAALSGISE